MGRKSHKALEGENQASLAMDPETLAVTVENAHNSGRRSSPPGHASQARLRTTVLLPSDPIREKVEERATKLREVIQRMRTGFYTEERVEEDLTDKLSQVLGRSMV